MIMRISTLGYTLKQGVKNIGRNKMFSLASIATMSACIFMFGLFFSILINFQNIVKSAEEGVAITIFFDEGLEQERIDEIGKELKAVKEVLKVEYTSGEKAWEEFKTKYFGKSADLAEGFADNPLVNSNNYQVYMKNVEDQEITCKIRGKYSGSQTGK